MRFFPPGRAGEIVLWETTNGVQCISRRREVGPPFEISIAHGDDVLLSMSFERNDDAAAFAAAAMYEGDTLRALRGPGDDARPAPASASPRPNDAAIAR